MSDDEKMVAQWESLRFFPRFQILVGTAKNKYVVFFECSVWDGQLSAA